MRRATARCRRRDRAPSGGRHHREDKRGVADRRRGVPGRRAAGTCVTSHLPPEIPRPAPRAVHRAAVGRSSDSWTRREERVMRKRNEGGAACLDPTRSSLLPTRSCHLLLVAASQGCAPVRVATSFPPTAAGQCRDGIIGSAPASLFIRRRKPTEPTATTYRGWIRWSTLHIQIFVRRSARRPASGTGHRRASGPLRSTTTGLPISGGKRRSGSHRGRRERVEGHGASPRPTTDAREVSALSSSRCRTHRSACIIPYRLPPFPPRRRARPRR
jgi:hypothetical protein